MPWTAAVFGWPGGLASIILSAFGLLIRRGSLVWVGALVGLPFMFYLFLTPRFWWVAAIAAPCHFGAAAATTRRAVRLGWLLFLPTPLVTWYVATAISATIR